MITRSKTRPRRSERLRLRRARAAAGATRSLGRRIRRPRPRPRPRPVSTGRGVQEVAIPVRAALPALARLPPVPLPANFSGRAQTRLHMEMLRIMQDPPEGCTAELINDNLFRWRASILGPPGTAYKDGKFYLFLHFGWEYPYEPPSVRFLTQIFHCNISACGKICLDILAREWSPAMTVSTILLSIRSLLADPNPDDPLVPGIAHIYKNKRSEFEAIALTSTHLYASPEAPAPNPE